MSRRLATHASIDNPVSGSLLVPAVSAIFDRLSNVPGASSVVDRLGIVEFRRRLLHMSPAFLPIGLPFIPHQPVWGPILTSLLVIVCIIGLFIALSVGCLVSRHGEKRWDTAVFGYAIPVIVPLFAFPGHAELGLMTLQIIALGDGSATLGGKMLGGPTLPWNSRKTYTGLFCFVLVGSLAATYSYWGETRHVLPVGTALIVCSLAAICAAIVESIPMRSNDNFRVGTTALIVGIAMTRLMTWGA